MEKNYKKICQDLLSELKGKEKEIILRRFGLEGKKKETLQSIGDFFGVTRERIRQIQTAAEKKVRKKIEKYKSVFSEIVNYFRKYGGVRKEETLEKELGGKEKNELFFLLELNSEFKKFNQDKNFYTFWAIDTESAKRAKETIISISQILEKEKKLMSFNELAAIKKIEKKILESFLEISKTIQKNEKGLYGLREWPEIKPRGVRDKAYLILKELKKPLHFTEVAKMIKGANVATVHNELIKDERFVLVGRGTYALSEWGYFPGEVKDVILKILREKRRPMTKEEILKEVKKQRIVKENTVFINLANKNYFIRDKNGKYWFKTAEI